MQSNMDLPSLVVSAGAASTAAVVGTAVAAAAAGTRVATNTQADF